MLVSADESLKQLVLSQCNHNNGCESEMLKDKVALELIWSRAMELCRSVTLTNFLKRHGKLASVCFHQGKIFFLEIFGVSCNQIIFLTVKTYICSNFEVVFVHRIGCG